MNVEIVPPAKEFGAQQAREFLVGAGGSSPMELLFVSTELGAPREGLCAGGAAVLLLTLFFLSRVFFPLLVIFVFLSKISSV